MQLKIAPLSTPHCPFAAETDIPVLVIIELRPLFRHVLRRRYEWFGRHLGGKLLDVAGRKEDTGIAPILGDQLKRTRRERARYDKAYAWRTHWRSLPRQLTGR